MFPLFITLPVSPPSLPIIYHMILREHLLQTQFIPRLYIGSQPRHKHVSLLLLPYVYPDTGSDLTVLNQVSRASSCSKSPVGDWVVRINFHSIC